MQGTVAMLDPHAGTVRYVAAADAAGVDRFTFRVNDGRVNSELATVAVVIGGGPVTLALQPGWNLVGVGADFAMDPSPVVVLPVWAWDGQEYFRVDEPNAAAAWHVAGRLTAGHGYWVFATQPGELKLH
jgi:hypothetical protein